MWIILIICIWIFFFMDGKTINECRLVLHSLPVAVCQLYLVLLPLRRAMRQILECVRQITVDISPAERLTNITVHFFEGALFLLLSTVRWEQRLVLDFRERKEEWEKNQERQRQAMQKEGEQVEEWLAEYCQDAITSVKWRRNQGEKTGHYL